MTRDIAKSKVKKKYGIVIDSIYDSFDHEARRYEVMISEQEKTNVSFYERIKKQELIIKYLEEKLNL